MTNLPDPSFSWNDRTDGFTEIIPIASPIKDVLYEIARQTYKASVRECALPLQSEESPNDDSLRLYFGNTQFSDDGRTIVRAGLGNEIDGELLRMDYVDALPVKTSIFSQDGKILFSSRLYNENHRAKHDHVLRMTMMTLDARI